MKVTGPDPMKSNVSYFVTSCVFEDRSELNFDWVEGLRDGKGIKVSISGYRIRGMPLPSPAATRMVREAEFHGPFKELPLVRLGVCSVCGSLIPELANRISVSEDINCPDEDDGYCAAKRIHES